MSEDPLNADRKSGRPRKGKAPRVPYEELDRILVFGEVVECEGGEGTTVQFPSYRTLARRFGVSHSLIAQYAKKHNCMRRREEAKARIAAKADQKLVELRATAIAMSKDDALRIIDNYLANFEKALAEGRVRFDNPGDFNTMLRLKEFIQGGADSRQEIHASLSLEDIQARHQRMMRVVAETPAAVRGEVSGRRTKSVRSGDRQTASRSPSPSFDTAAGEVTGQLCTSLDTDAENAPAAPESDRVASTRDGAPTDAASEENGDVARTRPHVASDALTEEDP